MFQDYEEYDNVQVLNEFLDGASRGHDVVAVSVDSKIADIKTFMKAGTSLEQLHVMTNLEQSL